MKNISQDSNNKSSNTQISNNSRTSNKTYENINIINHLENIKTDSHK